MTTKTCDEENLLFLKILKTCSSFAERKAADCVLCPGFYIYPPSSYNFQIFFFREVASFVLGRRNPRALLPRLGKKRNPLTQRNAADCVLCPGFYIYPPSSYNFQIFFFREVASFVARNATRSRGKQATAALAAITS